MNANIKSGGTAFLPVTYEPAVGFGPMLNAQDLIGLGVTKATVTGAIFEDRNRSNWYDAGEGLGGVQLSFQGNSGQFTFNAMSAGGYNAVVPAGTYTVTASGGGMRFPIVKPNVVVAAQNVWLNFLYDPESVPADAMESNNSPGSATVLSGDDQTIVGGTISRGDIDYFRLAATTTGPMTASLQFPVANGNLDLRLIDAGGATLAFANTSNSQETLRPTLLPVESFTWLSNRPPVASVEPITCRSMFPRRKRPKDAPIRPPLRWTIRPSRSMSWPMIAITTET